MDIVEVASYPKSGNTWLCNIITQYCHQQFGAKLTINGVHGKKSEIDNGESNVRLGANEFCIYKSHKRDHPLIQANRIIHIMRHPLDVFFSARNFLYLKAKNGQPHAFNKFLNNEPKSVEQTIKDGELNYYFDEFCESAGSNYWPGMLGDESNWFTYVKNALNAENTQTIKYESLIFDFEITTNNAMQFVFSDSYAPSSVNRAEVDSKTKNSGNKDFYWKSKQGTYKEFLSAQQITEFYKVHEADMNFLGYFEQ